MDHGDRLSRSCWRAAPSSSDITTFYTLVSSANIATLLLRIESGWLFTYNKKQGATNQWNWRSENQSMTINALLVNWHRLADANWWPINNHTKVVATHRLSSISVEKISVSYTFQPVCIRTRSTHKCLTFEFVHRIVCMLLHGFKNQQQKHALKQCFEETQVNNTPFRLAVPFAVLYTVDIWLIWIFRNFIFPLFPVFPTGPVHTPCKMKLLLSDLSV